MQEEIKISRRQAILLVLFAHIATTINFIPSALLAFLTQDAWITIVLGAILSIMFAYFPVADLGTRFPGQSLVQLSEKFLGKVLGKLLGLIIVYYLFIFHCWTLRAFGELMVAVTPGIPIWIFIVGLSLTTLYAVKSGLEVIGRCGEWLFPIGLLSLMVIAVFNFPNIDFANLLPVIENKLAPMIGASLLSMEWITTSSLALGIIMSSVKQSEDLKKIVIIGVGLGCFILTGFSIINIAVFGPEFIRIENFQLLILAQYGEVTTVFRRFESVIIILWVTWMFMRASIFSYSAVKGLIDLLNIQDYRFLVIPETILAVAYSIYMYDSLQEMNDLFNLSIYYLLSTAGIPTFLWLVGVFRLKFGKLKPVKKGY